MRLHMGILTFFFTLAGTAITSRGELLLNDDDQVIFFGNKVLEVPALSQGLESRYAQATDAIIFRQPRIVDVTLELTEAQGAPPPAQPPTPAKRPTPPSSPGGTP